MREYEGKSSSLGLVREERINALIAPQSNAVPFSRGEWADLFGFDSSPRNTHA